MRPDPLSLYVCPQCRGSLNLAGGSRLRCAPCGRAYAIVGGIPDFILEDLGQSPHRVLQRVRVFDWLARIYDWKSGYPLAVRVYAGWRVSHARVLKLVADMVAGVVGLFLDVACGPGTLGRRLAGGNREIYGVDVSWGMLRQGAALAGREGLGGVHFARSLAEKLPFPDACFDAALCGAAVHLLADPLAGLGEIYRTLKPGAPLAATTVIAGESGLFKSRAFREYMLADHDLRTFSLPALAKLTAEAGYEDYQAQVFGSLAAFRVRKPGDEIRTND